jgi:hypothetical protein
LRPSATNAPVIESLKLQVKTHSKKIEDRAGEKARETPDPGAEVKERESGAEPAASTKAEAQPADEQPTREEKRELPLTQRSPTKEPEAEQATRRPRDA